MRPVQSFCLWAALLHCIQGKGVQLWGKGKVPYILNVTDDNVTVSIKSAFHLWELKSCVQFTARVNEPDYVVVSQATECSADRGRTGGVQYLHLTSHCSSLFVQLAGRVLGLGYTHDRRDRNDYITVESPSPYFDIDQGALNILGYDYNSVMHSQPYAADGVTRVISSPEPTGSVVLSDGDISQINFLYNDCTGEAKLNCMSNFKFNTVVIGLGRLITVEFNTVFKGELNASIVSVPPDAYVVPRDMLLVQSPDFIQIRWQPREPTVGLFRVLLTSVSGEYSFCEQRVHANGAPYPQLCTIPSYINSPNCFGRGTCVGSFCECNNMLTWGGECQNSFYCGSTLPLFDTFENATFFDRESAITGVQFDRVIAKSGSSSLSVVGDRGVKTIGLNFDIPVHPFLIRFAARFQQTADAMAFIINGQDSSDAKFAVYTLLVTEGRLNINSVVSVSVYPNTWYAFQININYTDHSIATSLNENVVSIVYWEAQPVFSGVLDILIGSSTDKTWFDDLSVLCEMGRSATAPPPPVGTATDGSCTSLSSTSVVNSPITDLMQSSVYFQVPPTQTAVDVSVSVKLLHDEVSDVSVYLTSPNGTRIQLWTGLSFGMGKLVMDIVFTDAASKHVFEVVRQIDDTFNVLGEARPLTPLRQFNNTLVSGQWTLMVIDSDGTAHTGTLQSWNLQISRRCTNSPTVFVPLLVPVPHPVPSPSPIPSPLPVVPEPHYAPEQIFLDKPLSPSPSIGTLSILRVVMGIAVSLLVCAGCGVALFFLWRYRSGQRKSPNELGDYVVQDFGPLVCGDAVVGNQLPVKVDELRTGEGDFPKFIARRSKGERLINPIPVRTATEYYDEPHPEADLRYVSPEHHLPAGQRDPAASPPPAVALSPQRAHSVHLYPPVHYYPPPQEAFLPPLYPDTPPAHRASWIEGAPQAFAPVARNSTPPYVSQSGPAPRTPPSYLQDTGGNAFRSNPTEYDIAEYPSTNARTRERSPLAMRWLGGESPSRTPRGKYGNRHEQHTPRITSPGKSRRRMPSGDPYQPYLTGETVPLSPQRFHPHKLQLDPEHPIPRMSSPKRIAELPIRSTISPAKRSKPSGAISPIVKSDPCNTRSLQNSCSLRQLSISNIAHDTSSENVTSRRVPFHQSHESNGDRDDREASGSVALVHGRDTTPLLLSPLQDRVFTPNSACNESSITGVGNRMIGEKSVTVLYTPGVEAPTRKPRIPGES